MSDTAASDCFEMNWKSEGSFPVTLQGSVWGSWQVTVSVSLRYGDGKSSLPQLSAHGAHHSCDHASHGLWGGLGAFPIGSQTALQQPPAQLV